MLLGVTIYFGRSGPALHAISGVDIALWDIFGQVVKQPVSRLLGGIFTPRLKAYASALMPETPKEAAELALHNANVGYKAMKFGWGTIGRDPKLDEALEIGLELLVAWDTRGLGNSHLSPCDELLKGARVKSTLIPSYISLYDVAQMNVKEVKDLLRVSTGFVAWYLLERHAIMGAEVGNGIRLSIFSQTKTEIET